MSLAGGDQRIMVEWRIGGGRLLSLVINFGLIQSTNIIPELLYVGRLVEVYCPHLLLPQPIIHANMAVTHIHARSYLVT